MSEEEKKEVLGQEKDVDTNELDAVAGGDKCGCAIGGGGEVGYYDDPCLCIMGGGGEYNYRGEEKYGKKCRCACVIGGGGEGS